MSSARCSSVSACARPASSEPRRSERRLWPSRPCTRASKRPTALRRSAPQRFSSQSQQLANSAGRRGLGRTEVGSSERASAMAESKTEPKSRSHPTPHVGPDLARH